MDALILFICCHVVEKEQLLRHQSHDAGLAHVTNEKCYMLIFQSTLKVIHCIPTHCPAINSLFFQFRGHLNVQLCRSPPYRAQKTT